ncbi:MAG: hypothetical protein GY720_00110 [bacterium]|nr:hypothetical protein [bacterium]
MEFRVLGPLEVLDESGRVDPGGRKQRTVLALLVANAGQTITTDRLVDEIYGEDAGDGARHSVQTYVSNLRGRLGDIIISSGHAYKLQLDDSTVDSIEFAKQVQDARALLPQDCVAASRQMRAALEMWRGQPFQDVDAGRDLDLHITQLGALRMGALETRIDADLACGQHLALIGELEALTTEHPFRETFHSQLMLALYRSGRQAEALRAYQRTRKSLAEELGIDASPELRQLEQQILEQSPDLSLDPPNPMAAALRAPPAQVRQPPRTPVSTPNPPALHLVDVEEDPEEIAPVLHMTSNDGAPDAAADTETVQGDDTGPPPDGSVPSAEGSSPGRFALLAGLVGIAAVLGAVLYANVTGGSDTTTAPTSSPPTTTAISASAQVATPASPPTTQAPPDETVPDSTTAPGQPKVRTIQVGKGPQIVFADDSAIWSTLTDEAAIVRIDPVTTDWVKVSVGDNPTRPLDLDGRLWVPSRVGGLLVVVDKSSLSTIRSIRVGERLDTPVRAGGRVWVAAREDFKLVGINRETFKIEREITLSGVPMTPVFANGGLWVVGRDSGEVTRVDPFSETDPKTIVTLGKGAHPPILVGDEIWIVNRDDGTVTIIDTLKHRVEVTLPIGGKLSPPLLVNGVVWVSDVVTESIIPIDTARRRKGAAIYTGRQTTNLTVHEGVFWAAVPDDGEVIRIDPDTHAVNEFKVDGRPGNPLSAHGFLWVPDMSGTTITRISD